MSAAPRPETNERLDAALEYARLGYRVLPVCWPGPDGRCACGQGHYDPDPKKDRTGKAPLPGTGWQHAASTDLAELQEWWSLSPEANVGILLPDGVVGIDADHRPPDKFGPEDLIQLQQEHGELPPGPHFKTGGGGLRLLFRLPEGVRREDLRASPKYPGLELTKGGHCVLSPSMHRSGRRYEVVSQMVTPADLPQMPDWLVQMFLTPRPPEGVSDDIGTRLETLLRHDRSFQRVWNHHPGTDRSTGDHARACELVKRGVSDADGAAMLALAPVNPDSGAGQPKASERPDYGPRTMGEARAAVAAREKTLPLTGIMTTQREAETTVAPVRWYNAREFAAIEWPQRPDLVGPWMKERSITTLYSEAGVGKSFLAHSIALSLAGGKNLLADFGWTIKPEAVDVLLVDGELPSSDIVERLQLLWPWELPERLHILSDEANDGIPSLATDEGRDLIDRCLEDTGAKVLILDNLSTLWTGIGDHNAAESWDKAQSWLIGLRRRGLAVLTLDHSGKTSGKGPRGTSRKLDVVDVAIELTTPNGIDPADGCRFKLTWKKARPKFDRTAYVGRLEAILAEDELKRMGFRAQPAADDLKEQAARMLAAGDSPAYIIAELGMSKSVFYRAFPARKKAA